MKAKNRALILGGVSSWAVCLLSIKKRKPATALYIKTVKPVLIERDAESGIVRATSITTSTYQPSQNDLKYFLARYVTWTYTVHRLSTESDLEVARITATDRLSTQAGPVKIDPTHLKAVPHLPGLHPQRGLRRRAGVPH